MDETTKAMIKDMLKRGMDNATIMGVTGANQEQIDQVASEGKSSFLDNLGIFSTLQAAEVDPNQNINLLDVPSTVSPTREFGDMLVGREDQAIFGNLPRQDDLINYNEFYDMPIEERQNRGILQALKTTGGNVLDFIGGGGVLGTLVDTNPLSQRTFDAMTPGQQTFTSNLYRPGELLQGYNQISAFGKGAIGTLGDRLSAIQKANTQSKFAIQREQQIKDAIDKAINIGESEALSDSDRSVDYGLPGGPTRTDIDVADGGAETGGSGKIVCTMMNESYGFGSFRNKIWLKQSKDLAPEYQKGYHILFLPLVKIAKTNKTIKKVLEHIAVHRTIDIRQESRGKTHMLGRIYRKILEPICYWVGKYAKR